MPSSGGGRTAEQSAYSSPHAPLGTPGWPPPDAPPAATAVGCHSPFPSRTLLLSRTSGTYQIRMESAAQGIRSTTAGVPRQPWPGTPHSFRFANLILLI